MRPPWSRWPRRAPGRGRGPRVRHPVHSPPSAAAEPEPAPTLSRPNRVLLSLLGLVMPLRPASVVPSLSWGSGAGLVGAFAAGTAFTGGDDPGPTDGRASTHVAAPTSRQWPSRAATCPSRSPAGTCSTGTSPWCSTGSAPGLGLGYGNGGGVVAFDGAASTDAAGSVAESAKRTTAGVPGVLPRPRRVTNDASGTNVQELGVDEPDLVRPTDAPCPGRGRRPHDVRRHRRGGRPARVRRPGRPAGRRDPALRGHGRRDRPLRRAAANSSTVASRPG